MDTEPISILIELSQRNDPKAFGQLVNMTRHEAIHTALCIVGNREDASDIVQEAYIRLWNSIHHFNPNKPFHAWFRQIVRNLAIDCLRRRKIALTTIREEINPENSETPLTILENNQLMDIVRKWIPTLPRTQQMVFIMRDIENLSISEVRKVSEANRLIKKEFHPDRLLYLTRDELSTAEAATLAGNSPRSRPGSYQHDHPWTPFNTISKNYQNENKNLAYYLPHQ